MFGESEDPCFSPSLSFGIFLQKQLSFPVILSALAKDTLRVRSTRNFPLYNLRLSFLRRMSAAVDNSPGNTLHTVLRKWVILISWSMAKRLCQWIFVLNFIFWLDGTITSARTPHPKHAWHIREWWTLVSLLVLAGDAGRQVHTWDLGGLYMLLQPQPEG